MIVELCLILVSILLFVKYTFYLKKFKGSFKNVEDIPCPDGIPILGNISDIFCDEVKLWKEHRERALKYFPIYRTKILNFNLVCILDPEDIEIILRDDKLTKKGILYNTMKSWTGNGLIVSEGEIWRKRRKLLTKSFHFSILRKYIETFQKEADSLVDHLRKIKDVVKIRDVIKNFLLKAIHECIVGGKLPMPEEEIEEYAGAVENLTQIIGEMSFKPYMKWAYKYTSLKKFERGAKNVFHGFSTKICETFEENEDENWKMMSLMLSAPEIFDTKNIRDELDTFIFAGHDTTKAAISFALVALANYPEYQEEIYNELLQVTEIDDDFSYAALKNMSFLNRFVKETLRFFTIVPFIGRELREDVITKSGYKIPAGTTLIFHTFDIHHSPHLYPEPEKFDPDRFLPENSSTRHPYSYMPFGAGPRICIGDKFALLEIKTFICKILRKFKLEPVGTLDDLVFIPDLVLKTKDDLRVKFIERID